MYLSIFAVTTFTFFERVRHPRIRLWHIDIPGLTTIIARTGQEGTGTYNEKSNTQHDGATDTGEVRRFISWIDLKPQNGFTV